MLEKAKNLALRFNVSNQGQLPFPVCFTMSTESMGGVAFMVIEVCHLSLSCLFVM